MRRCTAALGAFYKIMLKGKKIPIIIWSIQNNFVPLHRKTKQLKNMRIKHFAGYGSVEAKKVSKTTFTDEYGEKKTKLVVRVKGNHEWGLVRDDIYDVKRWLFDKFEKNFLGKDDEISMSVVDDYVKENGLAVEVAVYIFVY